MKLQTPWLIYSTVLCILLSVHVADANAGERIAVCTADGVQKEPQALSGGPGGAIVAWADFRSEAGKQLYAQRIDLDGTVAWQADGLLISSMTSDPQIVWHNQVQSGDVAIFVWQDQQSNVYVQAVDPNGKMLWDSRGENQHSLSIGRITPHLLADGEGGVFLFWWRKDEQREGLYMLSIDATGTRTTTDDVLIVDVNQLVPEFEENTAWSLFVSDNAGGFYFVWVIYTDFQNSQLMILVHRFDQIGQPIWDAPTIISTPQSSWIYPTTVSDTAGGLIVVWQPAPNYMPNNIYAQRVDSTGEKLWGENGVTVCDAPSTEKDASISSDGKGGVVVVWQDDRDVFPDLYAQRIRSDGTPAWAKNGIPICTAGGNQTIPVIVPSGADRFFVAWVDYREDFGIENRNAVYGTMVNSDGQPLWETNGRQIYTADGNMAQVPIVVGSQSGEVNVASSDNGDIYLHRIRQR